MRWAPMKIKAKWPRRLSRHFYRNIALCKSRYARLRTRPRVIASIRVIGFYSLPPLAGPQAGEGTQLGLVRRPIERPTTKRDATRPCVRDSSRADGEGP